MIFSIPKQEIPINPDYACKKCGDKQFGADLRYEQLAVQHTGRCATCGQINTVYVKTAWSTVPENRASVTTHKSLEDRESIQGDLRSAAIKHILDDWEHTSTEVCS